MRTIPLLQQDKNRERFIRLCQDNISRKGVFDLISVLENSDFFVAPCSTRFHLCCQGGLCQHSLDVYDELIKLALTQNIDIDNYEIRESLTIIALFHDLCKVDFYGTELKNVKEGSQWVQRMAYVVKDMLPLGHGEKSLFFISRYMTLTSVEALAIRWHMGGFDNAVKGGEQAMNNALARVDLAPIYITLLHCADMIATHIAEHS